MKSRQDERVGVLDGITAEWLWLMALRCAGRAGAQPGGASDARERAPSADPEAVSLHHEGCREPTCRSQRAGSGL